ncbi:acyl-CoA desaturase [Thalassoglobus sp.]|uniref:acyl-CoA desaturase n=1 Tax=Thalassoglobus sp. TaxID=2795869 RepID=UPI003AA8AE93
MSRVQRMRARTELTNPEQGTIYWSPVKSLWYSLMLLVAVVGGSLTFSLESLILFSVLTSVTLCCGHSVGLHRLLIHRSFECPLWLERILVTMGVLVGMGGPRKMLYMHDIRDWSQRHSKCHDFFIHKSPIWKDWFWNLHCEIKLQNPPEFQVEPWVANSRYYGFLDRNWMLLQLPLAGVLFAIGGIPWVIWGACVRVAVSLTGHWLIGYFAHNHGVQVWQIENAAVQGYNLPGLGLITMGEAWHNNHHAFPESAKFGLRKGQMDAGWWLIQLLQTVGLAWNIQHPETLPERPERMLIGSSEVSADDYSSVSRVIL